METGRRFFAQHRCKNPDTTTPILATYQVFAVKTDASSDHSVKVSKVSKALIQIDETQVLIADQQELDS